MEEQDPATLLCPKHLIIIKGNNNLLYNHNEWAGQCKRMDILEERNV